MKRGRNLPAALLLIIALGLLAAPSSEAAQAKRRVISATINKGEIYTIDGVKPGAAPRIKVESNPNALVVRTDAPGKIVLLGADGGTWRLDVTLAGGEKVAYEIRVNAIAPPQGSLSPGSAPAALPVSPGSAPSAISNATAPPAITTAPAPTPIP